MFRNSSHGETTHNFPQALNCGPRSSANISLLCMLYVHNNITTPESKGKKPQGNPKLENDRVKKFKVQNL